MKYISGLCVNGVQVNSAVIQKTDELQVSMFDTDTGIETISPRVETYRSIGVWCMPNGVVAVKHTKQAVQLFDHLACIGYSAGTPEQCDIADIRFITRHYNMPDLSNLHLRSLQVQCKTLFVVVNGWGHSVVEIRDGGERYYITIYEFLVMMCRKMGLNIMAWHKVVFLSAITGFRLEIEFHHGEEHDRFFAKMGLMG